MISNLKQGSEDDGWPNEGVDVDADQDMGVALEDDSNINPALLQERAINFRNTYRNTYRTKRS